MNDVMTLDLEALQELRATEESGGLADCCPLPDWLYPTSCCEMTVITCFGCTFTG
ncbi:MULTISPECIES: ALQxL family class IV lanthipeptide [Streptomyces]|nr:MULTISPECIES: ALQxL family class IV lanthipeptide [Streptomyces]